MQCPYATATAALACMLACAWGRALRLGAGQLTPMHTFAGMPVKLLLVLGLSWQIVSAEQEPGPGEITLLCVAECVAVALHGCMCALKCLYCRPVPCLICVYHATVLFNTAFASMLCFNSLPGLAEPRPLLATCHCTTRHVASICTH